MKLFPILLEVAGKKYSCWFDDKGKEHEVPFQGHAEYIYDRIDDFEYNDSLRGRNGKVSRIDCPEIAYDSGWIRFESDPGATLAEYNQKVSKVALKALIEHIVDNISKLTYLMVDANEGKIKQYELAHDNSREEFFKDYARYLR